MALLQDLIQQIDDPALRERILQETNKLLKHMVRGRRNTLPKPRIRCLRCQFP